MTRVAKEETDEKGTKEVNRKFLFRSTSSRGRDRYEFEYANLNFLLRCEWRVITHNKM